MNEFLLGECQCGAVYVSEPTGFNVGSAMVECMVAACDDNPDLAWELEPDVDYLSSRLENYDEVTHYVYESREHEGRKIGGLLYFIRLTKDVSDLSSKLKEHKKGHSAKVKATAIGTFVTPEMEPKPDPKRKKQRVNKTEIKKWVEESNIDALVSATFDESKTLRFIQRLLYSPSEDERYHTAYVMGQVCRRVSTLKPGLVSDVLNRMYESCTDSASTHWGLIETIGSIIASRTDLFGAFSRHLLMYRGVDSSRALVLWAMATIAKESPEVIRQTPVYAVFDFIHDEDPQTRGNAVRLFGRINAMEVKSEIEKLIDDPAALTIHEDGQPHKTTVGALAKEALYNMGLMSENAKPAPLTLGNALL
ncbi:MAG: PBS lyase [Proteobacteria bacterium]|nr:PBS lyase [Pseudomonadota bacterium]MBU1638988.1 PBS lyase [Pseudomonadota bacterium]